MTGQFPRYPNNADYQTNAPTYYDDLARNNALMKHLAHRVWEYDKELGKRFAAWDANLEAFDDEVLKLLQSWMDDGTFEHIINEAIFEDLNGKIDTHGDVLSGYMLQNNKAIADLILKHENDVKAILQELNDGNVFIGLNAGKYAEDNHMPGVDSGNYSNVAIGGDALASNMRGWKNTVVGHSAMKDNKGGYNNVAVGDSALEHNIGDNGPTGTDALDSGSRNTALGSYALRYNKTGRGNVGVGRNAGHASESGNYNTSVGTNAYSGSVQAGNNDEPKSADYNVAMGYNALFYTQTGSENVGIGHHTGYRNVGGHSNVYVGANAGRDGFSSNRNTGVGFEALKDQNVGHDNVAVGARAAANFQTLNSSVAIGDSSLLFDVAGAPLVTGEYVTGIGKQSRVSGDYQVQLGMSQQTTYAFGAIQNRSDARDKADVEDTKLGLDFINKLRPVDFRWNYRDDYVEYYEEKEMQEVKNEETGELEMQEITVVKSRTKPNDGSKKRTRKHHGLIAQEVRQVMTDNQVEFGGFQDHTINGGSDVLSIGYEELIAPLIKAVQELTAQVEELKNR